jgi:hypothetical protein
MKLSSTDLIRILTELLPLLNNESILMLNKKYDFETMFVTIIQAYCEHNETKYVEGSNEYPKYLYDRKSFKIIDLIIKYNLLRQSYYLEILPHLFDFCAYDDKNHTENCEIMVLYFYYLLNNEFTSSEKIIEKFNRNFNHKQLYLIFGPLDFNLIINSLNFVLNLNVCLTPSLVNLAKFEIKNSIQSISDEILSELDLPLDALNEIKRTFKLNQVSFYEYFSNKEKYIDKIIKTKFKWLDDLPN